MAAVASPRLRVSVDGKFFRLGEQKFYVKGLTYGPFAPNDQGEPLPSVEQIARDFALIRELGANVLRVYHVPPRWFLDLAAEQGLRLLVDVAWNKHLCFLEDEETRDAARLAVHEAATACAGHPAVFALCLVNEIPQDIVRWSGPQAVADFIDELVAVAKAADPERLCTFGNFPTTEFLHPQDIDFHTFNVYLHHPKPFENYLARLQMLADTKPLILGECGMDSRREGEARQNEALRWQIETAFRSGLAGAFVYSFTDDWFKDGRQIEDWEFGVTTRDRLPKPAFLAVQQAFGAAPWFPLSYYPLVSVVVASYNGARTLKTCLDSLEQLNYPACEVLLIDDGSTDATSQIASLYPNVQYVRHEANRGLSAARNTGIELARGEVIAFTDSDCRADEDWLYYLVGDLLNSTYAGIGGHNFLPADDSWVAAAVMVSPGGPAHVMLTDRVAEHIPGCNMAFYKWALEEVGGFDPLYRKAGDDVDVCWRLQERGYKIGFSPAGFVWHYRRSTLRAYLEQQRGYGEAEALLVRKHPEYFNSIGGSLWKGRIYAPTKAGISIGRPMIYHGLFGSALFQTLYGPQASVGLTFLTSLEYHLLVTAPLFVLGAVFHRLWPLAVASLLISVGLCVLAAAQANLPKRKQRFWSRPLVALLYFLQPIVRGGARYHGRLLVNQTPLARHESLDTLEREGQKRFDSVQYWARDGIGRIEFLRRVLDELDQQGWQNKTDAGWNDFDVEIYGSRWCVLQLVTAAECHSGGQQMIRCRLRTGWSLLAGLAFWSALGFELLLVGMVGDTFPSIRWLLLSMVGFAWMLYKEERDLQRIISVFLDGVAKKLGLIRLDLQPAEAKAEGAEGGKP